MTPRRHLVLRLLARQDGWARPAHIGGSRGSYHSRQLGILVDVGYAERRTAHPGRVLPRHEYRITTAGERYLQTTPRPTKEMTDGRQRSRHRERDGRDAR